MAIVILPPALGGVVGGDGAGTVGACADFSRDGYGRSFEGVKMDKLEGGVCEFGDDGIFSELNGNGQWGVVGGDDTGSEDAGVG